MKYLFVVGCPRSGTTWASWLLAQHPATVIALHTGFFQSLDKNLEWLDRPTELGNRVVGAQAEGADDDADPLSLWDLVGAAEVHAACRPLAECLLDGVARANPEADWVVEKTPENLLHADLIRAVLPEARILHLIRDPRAVFSSMRMAAKQWAYPGDLPTNPAAFARGYWLQYVGIHDRLVDDAERYRAVQYEHLLENGAEELAKIFEWLDLPADRAFCEQALEASSMDRMRKKLTAAPRGFFRSGKADSWKRELSRGQLRTIEYLAGDQMERFGYHCANPNPRRTPLRLRLADALVGAGRKLVEGPLARPLSGLFGRARRSAETVRRMTS